MNGCAAGNTDLQRDNELKRAVRQIEKYQTRIALITADLPGVAIAAAEIFLLQKITGGNE